MTGCGTAVTCCDTQTLFGATIGCGLGQPLTLLEHPQDCEHELKLLHPHVVKLLHPQDVGLHIGLHVPVIEFPQDD